MTRDLWRTYGDRLRRLVHSKIRQDADAEDVLQDVFLKLHAAEGSLLDPAKAEAWVVQIARRAVIDQLRRRRPGAPLPDPEAPTSPSPAGTELAACLPSMMEKLPAEDREALQLADLEGMSRQALADRFGLSLPGAKSRVQRARRRLKEAVLDCCDVELDPRGNPVSYSRRVEFRHPSGVPSVNRVEVIPWKT